MTWLNGEVGDEMTKSLAEQVIDYFHDGAGQIINNEDVVEVGYQVWKAIQERVKVYGSLEINFCNRLIKCGGVAMGDYDLVAKCEGRTVCTWVFDNPDTPDHDLILEQLHFWIKRYSIGELKKAGVRLMAGHEVWKIIYQAGRGDGSSNTAIYCDLSFYNAAATPITKDEINPWSIACAEVRGDTVEFYNYSRLWKGEMTKSSKEETPKSPLWGSW
jgi:uncharacterized membrane protein